MYNITKNSSIYNIIRWFAGRWDKRLVNQASEVPSIIFFPKIMQNSLQKPFQLIFFMKLQK